jgi:hypothetical protein
MIYIPKGKKRPWIAKRKAVPWTANPEHKRIYDSEDWKKFRLDYLVRGLEKI